MPSLSRLRERRVRRKAIPAELQDWHDAKLKPVEAEVCALVENAVSRELESRSALNTRVTSTMTLAGALLAASFALAKSAADLRVEGSPSWVFSVSFVGTVALLVLAILISAAAIGPEPRHMLSPALMRHWGEVGTSIDEARTDRYKLDVALAEQLATGNQRRSAALRRAQRLIAGALLFAAGGAISVFLQWP
jgi:hypothetical protein